MLMCSAQLIGGLCKEQSAQADPAAAQAARSGLDGAAAMGMRSQQPQKRLQPAAVQNPHGVAGARPRGTGGPMPAEAARGPAALPTSRERPAATTASSHTGKGRAVTGLPRQGGARLGRNSRSDLKTETGPGSPWPDRLEQPIVPATAGPRGGVSRFGMQRPRGLGRAPFPRGFDPVPVLFEFRGCSFMRRAPMPTRAGSSNTTRRPPPRRAEAVCGAFWDPSLRFGACASDSLDGARGNGRKPPAPPASPLPPTPPAPLHIIFSWFQISRLFGRHSHRRWPAHARVVPGGGGPAGSAPGPGRLPPTGRSS